MLLLPFLHWISVGQINFASFDCGVIFSHRVRFFHAPCDLPQLVSQTYKCGQARRELLKHRVEPQRRPTLHPPRCRLRSCFGSRCWWNVGGWIRMLRLFFGSPEWGFGFLQSLPSSETVGFGGCWYFWSGVWYERFRSPTLASIVLRGL